MLNSMHRFQNCGRQLPLLSDGILMDDVHLLTARHFRYELRRGGKIFSSKFGAREVCIAPQDGIIAVVYYVLSECSPCSVTWIVIWSTLHQS